MSSEHGVPVDLYIYDLTKGLANLLSYSLLGRQIEGVWHTAIVVFDMEFFYGGQGISNCSPGDTVLGQPLKVQRLGNTFVPYQVFVEYIEGLSTSTYAGSKYDLLEHNCNHFSDEVAQFLCGSSVPKHIVQQPEHALSPAQLQTVRALLDTVAPNGQPVYANGVRHSRRDSPEFLTLNTQIEEARMQSQALEQRRSTLAEKVARKERKKEKKRKKLQREKERLGLPLDDSIDDETMAEAVEAPARSEELSRAGPSSESLEVEADERRQEEIRKRSRDPPVVYKDIDGAQEYEKLVAALNGVELSPEEKQSLDELQQYLVQGEGSWALGDDFLAFIGRLLNDGGISSDVRVCALRSLAACALRDDVSLVLHQDRRDHTLVNFAYYIDRHPVNEQNALALFMCNLFENISSSEWLLYISEWEHNGQPLSNIRVTTKVAVHSLLSEEPELRELGTALMHNIATKERFQMGKALRDLLPKEAKSKVFDDVCVELAMALLQLLQAAPAEEHLFRACKALARLVAHSQEVPQLVALVGPDPATYRGTSERVDEQIELIMKKVK